MNSFQEKTIPSQLYPNFDETVWLRSCRNEIIQPINGKVTGIIPAWLQGSLIRNGPGSLKAGNDVFEHLFDSSALLHRFNIENENVTYQCRFLQSEVYKRNNAANRIISTEFGTKSVAEPCKTIFQRVAAIFNPKSSDLSDNSMISVYPFGDEIYAFGELPIIHKINQKNLETEKRVNISENVSIVHHTSHPHVVENGTVYNLAETIYPTGPHHTIVEFSNQNGKKNMFESAKIVAGIRARWRLHPSYMHTFGLTENYFIIVEQPFSISLKGLISAKIQNEPLISTFRWYKNEKTQINVISRKTGSLAYIFFADSFFYFHIINQYELSEHIVLDICTYKDPASINCMYTDAIKNLQQNLNYAQVFRSKPLRFILPLKPQKNTTNLITLPNTQAEAFFLQDGKILVVPEVLSQLSCETPRINYSAFLGKPYRYFYAMSSDIDSVNPGTLIKVDTVSKTAKTWCETNCYPSEPVFVPRLNSQFEDDGVILAALVWGKDECNRVGLIILDAEKFTEIGRAEFRTPGPVPKCLHGWFLPKK